MPLSTNPISVQVTSAGTAVRFTSTTSLLPRAIQIRAREGNTGMMYYGDASVSSTDGMELSPGESHLVSVTASEDALQLSSFYADAATSNDRLDVSKVE
jgi:hypothetical protein